MKQLKPFNLEQALAGAPVITRDGMRVIRLIELPEAKPKSRLVAVFEDGETATFHKGGRYYSMRDSSLDLFMATTKKEGWINVYNVHSLDVTGKNIYPTEEAALANKVFDCITTIKIEWEE